MALPAIIAGLAAVGGGIYSAWSAKREAEKNRDFQERMSSTAHRRAVQDMKLAGINPMMAAGSAASSPSGSVAQVPDFGEIGSKSVLTALAVKQARENLILTRSQAAKNVVEAEYTTMQSRQIGEGGVVRRQREMDLSLSELNLAERRNLFAPVIARAYAEVDQIGSASRAANARAALDEFAKRGAMNAAEVDELVAKFPEWARLFGPLMSKLATGGVAGAAVGASMRKPTVINRYR